MRPTPRRTARAGWSASGPGRAASTGPDRAVPRRTAVATALPRLPL
jgi:hypothetical protein